MSDLASQIVIGADVEGVVTGTARAAKSLKDLGRAAGAAGQEAATGTKVVGDAAEQTTQKVDRATKNAIASFERAIASQKAAGKGQAEFLAQLATDRGANTKRLAPYIAELQELTAKNKAAQDALRSSEAAMGGLGMSAKATTAALRQVPAQLTDIVVSLQGGQAPMTVLLQQGGQLKDVFGGIGPAAKAMGGYILGLVNPFTLAAAAVGGLTYAYYVGSKELDGYRNALILSGNAAGTTAAQMQLYAASISKTVGTQHDAAAALAEMASTGKIAGASLEYFSAVALKMEKTVGQAVSKTAEQFAELARNPVAASEKLNETTNYLTASVYSQIKALEEQGKTLEAGALAQKAYADALNSRMGDIKDNMGWIESGWRAIVNLIKEAGDATLKVGRAPTPTDQRATLVQNLENQQDRNKKLGIPDGAATEALKQQIAYLDEADRLSKRVADSKAEQASQTRAAIEWEKEGGKYLSNRDQMEKAILKTRNDGLAAGRSEVEIQARISEVRKKFNVDNLDLSGQIEAIKQAERLKQEAFKQTADVLQTSLKIGIVTERDYIVARGQLAVEGLNAQKTAVQAEISLASKKKDSQKEIASLTGQVALIEKQIGTEKIKTDLALLELAKKRIDAINAVRIAEEEELKVSQAASEKLYGDRWNTSLQAANEFLRTQKEANEQTAFEATLVGKTTEQRTLLIAQYRASVELKKQLLGIDGELLEQDREALKTKYEEAATLAKNNAATAASMQETQRIIDSIDSTAHSVWTNVTQGGQDAFTKIGNTIKSAVLDLLYQLTIKKWVISIAASVTGSVATAQNAPGGGNPISSIASIFKGSGSSWMTDFGGSLSNSVSDFGTAMVDKGFTKFGTSLEGFGLDLQSVSGTINQFGDGLGYLNAAMAASKGQWGNAIGSAVGTYFGGPIGAAIGSKIGSWVDNLTGNTGTKPSIEGGYSTAGDPGTNGKAYLNGYYGGALDASQKLIVDGLSKSYIETVKALGGKAGTFTASQFTGIDQNGHASAIDMSAFVDGKAVYNRFSDLGTNKVGSSDAEVKAAVELSSKKALLAALKATDLAPALNEYLATVTVQGKSLEEVTATLADITAIGAFENAIKGLPFDYLAKASGTAVLALANAAGSIDTLTANLGTYYNAFYSDSERANAMTKLLSQSFGELGVTMPTVDDTTRAWFRSIVDVAGAQDLSIEANQKAYTALLALASQVDQVAKQAEDAAKLRQSWQDKYDIAAGKATERQIALRTDLANTSDAATQQLIRQYYAQLDATDATTKAAKDAADALAAAKQAQDEYAAAVKTATSNYEAAKSAVASALTAVQGVQAQATDAYITAQNRVAAAQDSIAQIQFNALVDLANQANATADRIGALGKTLRETLTTQIVGGSSPSVSTQAASADFFSNLTKARAGDESALSSLSTSGKALLDAAQNSASSSAEYAKLRAQVLQGIAEAASIAEQKAAIRATAPTAESELVKAQRELASAQAELTSALYVANAINAPLVKQQTDLIAQYGQAQSAYLTALAQLTATQEALRAIGINTGNTADNTATTAANTLAVFHSLESTIASKFDKLDTNGSGGLTFDELVRGLGVTESIARGIIEAVDTNGDGTISKLELINASTNKIGALQAVLSNGFDKLDANASGTLSFDELKTGLGVGDDLIRALINRVDTNGDGTISKLELINSNTAKALTKQYTVFDANDPLRSVWDSINVSTGWLNEIHSYIGAIHNLQFRQYDLEAISAYETQQLANRSVGVNGGIIVRTLTQGGSMNYFAQGGAFTNGIVSSATKFYMGTMGEAGPEAIMPLSRTANGDLGVQVLMPDWSKYGRSQDTALLAEVRALREDNRAQASAIVSLNTEINRRFQRWDGNGLPETRVTA